MIGRAPTPPRQVDLATAPAPASSANQTAPPPVHALASAKGADGVEAPDADAVAKMRAPEPIGGDITHDIPTLRWIWWQHRGLGFTYPAELGIIVLEGGRP